MYGENVGLKNDIKKIIISEIKNKDNNVEILSLYENEVIDNEENFYNLVYSGSLFSEKKIISVYAATDKLIKNIENISEKLPESITLIFFSENLEKKSKLRNFFEKNKSMICLPCYLDNNKDLEIIANLELKNIKIKFPQEIINLLIEKSNYDRNNLRNEIKKIESFALNKKKIDLEEIKLLINFTGDHKSDNFVNECLCGNMTQFKKILSELYITTVNQILLFRILSNKSHRLIKIIKEQQDQSSDLDSLINSSKPPIFWKEKPIVKKQLSIWNLNNLVKMVDDINATELLCKKNPQISQNIFLNFFSEICKKANNFS